MAKTRFVGALLIALGAAACTTDDGVGQGLLNQDDNTVSPEDAELRIIGPGGISSGGISVVAACDETGFIAELTNGSGRGVPNVFVRVRPDLGTVVASNGSSNGGATTDSQGRARFDYIAPSNVAAADFDVLAASTSIEDVAIESDDFEVEIIPGPVPDLTLVGPGGRASGEVEVSAGAIATGFLASVRPGTNCQPRNGHQVNLTVLQGRIDAPPGDVNSGGGLTGSGGLLEFDFKAPDFITSATDITIEGTATVARQTDRANFVVRVLPPVITITGPDTAFPGDTRQGYRLVLTRSDGRPLSNQRVSLSATQGTVRHVRSSSSQANFTTDSLGAINFTFTPPSGIEDEVTIPITAQAFDLGIDSDILVTVLPNELELTGPADAFPGEDRTGFRAKLTLADGRVVPDEQITIIASRGTVTHDRSSSSPGNFRTDTFGEIDFVYTPPANIVEATNVFITATATESSVEKDIVVTVRPNSFRFTSPTANQPITVGVENAVPLLFEWLTAAGSGVQGSVNLASSSPDARFLVNTDVESRGRATATVDTNSSGQFGVPVSVFSNFSEFVTITATDADNGQQIARLPLQFVDSPGSNPDSAILTATPALIDASTNPGARADLLFQVTNDANEPIDGLDVIFTLVGGSTHPNEEIFPVGGTTRQGEARSTYFTRPGTGAPVSVLLRACLEDGSLCDDFQITVE